MNAFAKEVRAVYASIDIVKTVPVTAKLGAKPNEVAMAAVVIIEKVTRIKFQ